MSKVLNGKMRTSPAREAYVRQVPYNRDKKRNSFTSLHSYDDSDVAYRSAPEYLKQLMNTSMSSTGHSTRTLTRTHSASDITSTSNLNRPVSGNPKYKTQEEYYDEIQYFKKELKFTKDDNNNLRARIRRLEEDNARKRKEIDNFYETNKDTDLRRTSDGSTKSTANVVMNLKQRLFKLDLQLKQKEATIDEMKTDPRWTKSTEIEIINHALLNEIEKLKLEKLNFIQNDYMASIDEEKKNAVRKLEAEKRELKIENESLKKKVRELENPEHDELLSARRRDDSPNKDLRRKIEGLNEACRDYRMELEHKNDELKQLRHERDQYRKKSSQLTDDLEELRAEQNRKMKTNETNRSSPISSRDDDRGRKVNQSPRSRHDSNRSDEFIVRDSHTPTRKSKEHIGSHSPLSSRKTAISSTVPPQNWRRHGWTSFDEDRLKRFREKHAATIIQRGWREHNKSYRSSITSKTRQNNFDKRNPKIGGMKSSEIVSPRTSPHKFGSNIDHLDSSYNKNRPTSAGTSNESALKSVQAALRGCIKRLDMGKPSRSQIDDDDFIRKPSKQFGPQYESDRKRENFFKTSITDSNRLYNDKIGSNSRLPISNRDSISNFHQSASPPLDRYRPLSPNVSGGSGSKQPMPYDRNKFGFENRSIHESPLKPQRPSSPSNDHRSSPRMSPEDARPSSRLSNTSLRKSTAYSKQPPKNGYDHDDDDDIEGF
ncbi:unnamed protein product [Rotaria socialis]|uniref:Uncharacterized protein n=1 Tax=Rotaria socialis TaxID=392032 RepID=A0A818KUN9_9BILA|nr:unnamed protein product [Rotaria socialis]CAF4631961.1 unnamed protein product [Rotaria socialis]